MSRRGQINDYAQAHLHDPGQFIRCTKCHDWKKAMFYYRNKRTNRYIKKCKHCIRDDQLQYYYLNRPPLKRRSANQAVATLP